MELRSRNSRHYIVLTLLCLAFYLPGISTLPPVDRDEARFAQATAQMIESGDFVQIRFQNEPRNKKPIGVYWLQAASVSLFGASASRAIWAYRIPSLLGAILTVFFTFAFGRRYFGERAALLGSALFAGALLLSVEAHMAKTDAVLAATIVASQLALARFYLREGKEDGPGKGAFLLFWISQAIGILIKGPLTPLWSLLTIAGLAAADRNLRWLKGIRPFAGMLLVLVIASPWAIAIALATKGVFFQQALGGDLMSKVVSGQESHGFPPGYYLLLMPLTLWPASLFAGLAMYGAWKERVRPAIRFCLACIIPAWILFELIPTKLPHYVLPAYPFICLLVGSTLVGGEKGEVPELRSKLARTGFISCFLVLLALGFGPLALAWFLEGRFEPVALAPAAAAAGTAAFAIRKYLREKYVHAVAVALTGTMLVLGPTLQYVLPGVNSLWLSRTAAEAIKEAHPTVSAVAAVGYHEPSLVFLMGTDTLLTGPVEAAKFLRDNPKGMVLTGGKEDEKFQEEVKKLELPARLVGSFRGFNYSKGRKMVLRLYSVGASAKEEGS